MKRGVDGAARNTRGRSKRQPPQQSWSTPTNGQAPAAAPRRFFPPTPATNDLPTQNCADPWTEEEDAVLREGVLRFGTGDWSKVARHLLPPINGGPQKRTPDDCQARWDAAVRHAAVKGPWLPEEDNLLRQLVAKFGPKRWALIASHIPGRAGKQCRERWLNHLDSRVVKSDWTPDEDAILLDAQQRVGNKWSEIARGLPGRAENAVKNRFNSLITKRLTHGLEAQARRRDRQSESRGEADAAEARRLGERSAKELLQLMFRRMGETRHVQHRTPPLAGQIGGSMAKLTLNPDGRRTRQSSGAQQAAAVVSDVAQAELRGLLVAAGRGLRKFPTKISGSVAFKRDEWDALEKRAERKAQTEPGLVAQMAEAAAACLGGALLAPPSPKAAPQRSICDSPRGGDERRRRVRRPRRRGQEEPPPQDDGLAMRLSATLCSLSLDDASWLGDVIDTSFDGVERSRASRDWAKGPANNFPRNRGRPPLAPPPPTMSTSSAGLKLSASIDDWGGTLVGASVDQRPITGISPASEARVATTLQEMSARPDPTPSTQPASDASMSLDQVDWDLILKATGSTPGGRTRRGAAPIDFDPAPRPATAPEDLTPRARELLAKSRSGA